MKVKNKNARFASEETPVVVKLNDEEFNKLVALAKKSGHKPGPHLTFRTKKFLAKVASNPTAA